MNNEKMLTKVQPILIKGNDGKWNGKTIISGANRCSFVHVFKKYHSEEFNYDEFCISNLIPKGTPEAAMLEKAIAQVYRKKFGKDMPRSANSCLADGDDKADKYPEMAGHWVLKMGSKDDKRPLALDVNKNEIDDPTEIYSGCYVRCKFDMFAYPKGKTGVACKLLFVQKLADAEPFGGVSTPERAEDVPDLPEELRDGDNGFDSDFDGDGF